MHPSRTQERSSEQRAARISPNARILELVDCSAPHILSCKMSSTLPRNVVVRCAFKPNWMISCKCTPNKRIHASSIWVNRFGTVQLEIGVVGDGPDGSPITTHYGNQRIPVLSFAREHSFRFLKTKPRPLFGNPCCTGSRTAC